MMSVTQEAGQNGIQQQCLLFKAREYNIGGIPEVS
jgi:hypothetical protein